MGKAVNLYEDAGYKLSGSSYVINKLLGTSWLWDRVRVSGGAYGGFRCSLLRSASREFSASTVFLTMSSARRGCGAAYVSAAVPSAASGAALGLCIGLVHGASLCVSSARMACCLVRASDGQVQQHCCAAGVGEGFMRHQQLLGGLWCGSCMHTRTWLIC